MEGVSIPENSGAWNLETNMTTQDKSRCVESGKWGNNFGWFSDKNPNDKMVELEIFRNDKSKDQISSS